MLEYWIWRNERYFYIDGPHQKLKSRHHLLLTPTIPFFHYSIIPGITEQQNNPSGVKSKRSHLSKDS
jgi:hypothetical protein